MLGKNIIKFREENNMSQQELAEKIGISRQSISKWETGNALPSIDNLITLSGMLDVSLDELITGEPYIYFPFHFGKPKNKKALYLLFVLTLLTFIFTFNSVNNSSIVRILVAVMITFMVYSLLVNFIPYDFKKHYNYWTLTKKEILYNEANYSRQTKFLAEFYYPILALFNYRKEYTIPYKEISRVEVVVVPFKYDPSKAIALNWYTPRYFHIMHEPILLVIYTNDGEKVYLNAQSVHHKDAIERKYLYPILLFLERKGIEIVDPNHLAKNISDNHFDLSNFYNEDQTS